MTRRRFIADEVSGDRAALTGEHAAHLARVLRARVGQQFDIAADGVVRLGTVTSVADDRVEFALGEAVEASPAPEVCLLLAVFKFDRFEWAVEKCTELGVARIVPVIARRTESHLATAAAKRAERWRRIAREAAQQSRRTTVPAIDEPMRQKQALALDFPLRLLLNENEQSLTLRDALGCAEAAPSPLAVAVGPEGGWTEEEIAAFAGAGWKSVSIGETILRAETAAIAALAALNTLLD